METLVAAGALRCDLHEEIWKLQLKSPLGLFLEIEVELVSDSLEERALRKVRLKIIRNLEAALVDTWTNENALRLNHLHLRFLKDPIGETSPASVKGDDTFLAFDDHREAIGGLDRERFFEVFPGDDHPVRFTGERFQRNDVRSMNLRDLMELHLGFLGPGFEPTVVERLRIVNIHEKYCSPKFYCEKASNALWKMSGGGAVKWSFSFVMG